MDLALVTKNGCIDIEISGQDFTQDGGLNTAVLISLYSNRRVTAEQLPELATDRQGWWGDMIADIENDQIGSRLWTLERRKKTNETLRLFEDYVLEALNWMILDGISDEILVTGSYNSDNELVGELTIKRPNEVDTRFSILWEQQILKAA